MQDLNFDLSSGGRGRRIYGQTKDLPKLGIIDLGPPPLVIIQTVEVDRVHIARCNVTQTQRNFA